MRAELYFHQVELSEHDVQDMWEILMDDRYNFEYEICDYLREQARDDNFSNEEAVKELYEALKEYYETPEKQEQ